MWQKQHVVMRIPEGGVKYFLAWSEDDIDDEGVETGTSLGGVVNAGGGI
jgi:hypothetical protein